MDQRIGRGIIAIGLAQIILVSCNWGIHIGLARLWGPELYGMFAVIISILVWFEILANSGIPATVKKFIAENEEHASSIMNVAIRMEMILTVAICLIIFVTAPLIASLLNDKRLTFYLRLAAVDVPFMAYYMLFHNTLGGLRHFVRNAIAIAVYGISRIGSILLLVLMGFSLNGALIGNIIASIVALFVAKYLVGIKQKAAKYDWKKVVKFATPYTLYCFVYHFLMCLDLLLVKALIQEPAQSGFYASATSFARVPYFVFYSLTITLLPCLSNSISQGDRESTKRYINQALRFLLILLIPGIMLITATSGELISLVYSSTYLAAGSILSILIFGAGFLCCFLTLNTILVANNELKKVLLISILLVPIDLILNWKLIPLYGTQGAAIATTLTMLLGCCFSAIFVFRRFGTLIALPSFLKVVVASLIISLLCRVFYTAGPLLLLKYSILYVVYFLLLYVSREIRKDDLKKIQGYLCVNSFRRQR
ncbi:MAG: oligosaccharide flippase family protein [Candidatus Omnitrophota bacterium]